MQDRITLLLLHHSLVDCWRFGGLEVLSSLILNPTKLKLQGQVGEGEGIMWLPSPFFKKIL